MRKSVRPERCGFRSSRRVLRFLTGDSKFTNHHAGFSVKNYYMQGFAPADESLLFRQKEPKPFSPVRGGASVPNKMARELALLKQPSPERPIRDRGSAAPEGELRSTLAILY